MEKNGLTIVIDRAGTGKSAYILDQIKKNGVYREQLLLVPDHASHQAERDLCAFCGDAENYFVIPLGAMYKFSECVQAVNACI